MAASCSTSPRSPSPTQRDWASETYAACSQSSQLTWSGCRPVPPLVKIRSERDQMSAIERRIADFLLDNAHLLRDYSSQQLADALKISQSSVVKFSQKLGFRGYPDLKFSVGEEIARA